MIYAIWDVETNNLVAEYESQREALALVLCGIQRNGPQDADVLTLEVENERGEVTTIASGQALVDLARREFGAMPLVG